MPIKVDETLIIQALNKATGAKIHTVKNVIGSYRSSCHFVEEGKMHWLETAEKNERKLRAFIVTGEIEF